MANQFTSELVGVERKWATAMAERGPRAVDELLVPFAKRAQRRSILAWLQAGAPYDFATAGSISLWRRVLAAAGEPPVKSPTRTTSPQPPISDLAAA
jgi:hypothetical protein